LALALGERAVRAHRALPGHVGVVAGRADGAREARRARRQVAVGGHEALWDRAQPAQHLRRPAFVHSAATASSIGLSPSSRSKVTPIAFGAASAAATVAATSSREIEPL